MEFYKDIFVILTYKNTEDILELLESIHRTLESCKVIIVNSFYDEETKNKFAEIAKENHCDYIPVENKGYGYGNNKGIAFAKDNYEFDRIVISNPDITIEEYNTKELDLLSDGVIGGIIINARGRNQNPLRVSDWDFTNYSPYYLYVKKNRAAFYFSILFAKLQRVKLLFTGSKKKVFSIHGSFLAIPRAVLEKVPVLYDENLFLFEEEIDIAKLLKSKGIATYYTKAIRVNHKEDGDVSVSNLNNAKLMADSLNYVRNKWSGDRR